MTQGNDAAERSAHVTRGAAERETVGPCVEVAPGQWRLRALVEAEAEIARLRAENAQMEQANDTLARIAQARADAVTWLEAEVVALRAQLAPTPELRKAWGDYQRRCTCDDPPGAGLGERGA